jgi:hypothetical protein
MKKNAFVTSVLWLAGFSATLLLSNARALAFEMTASGKVVPLGVVIDGRYYNGAVPP